MSKVRIEVIKSQYGFSDIIVDGQMCGTLEDLDDNDTSVADVMRNIIKALDIDNTEVIEKRE